MSQSKRFARSNEKRRAAMAALVDRLVADIRQSYHVSCRDDVGRGEIMRGRCQSFVKALCKAFPECKPQAGFISTDLLAACSEDDRMPGVEHWWVVMPDGSRYDPTVEQFGEGPFCYTEYRRDYHYVYKGKCMNCGCEDYALADAPVKTACSTECAEALDDYYAQATGGQ